MVTLVAAVHYFYRREFWVQLHSSLILYRYIGWTITGPLQMIESHLTLAAVKPDIEGEGVRERPHDGPVREGSLLGYLTLLLRQLLGTMATLGFGYVGEAKFLNPRLGVALGMAGWAFILIEAFLSEAGKVCGNDPKMIQSACGCSSGPWPVASSSAWPGELTSSSRCS